jgi:hypothetical protein
MQLCSSETKEGSWDSPRSFVAAASSCPLGLTPPPSVSSMFRETALGQYAAKWSRWVQPAARSVKPEGVLRAAHAGSKALL